MTGLNQTEFARHAGYAKSHVTQLKKDGRLVFNDDGSIDAAASLARIAATADPAKAAVAERHANARAETAPGKSVPDGAAEKVGLGYKYHQARKMKADADMAEAELAEKHRRLIPIESADFALSDLAAAVRSRLELLPASLTPQLAACSGPAQIEAHLVEMIEAELTQLASHLRRAAEELKGTSA